MAARSSQLIEKSKIKTGEAGTEQDIISPLRIGVSGLSCSNKHG